MLTDTQWAMLEPLVEQCRPKGKTPPQDLRRTLEAILWRHQNGAKWRAVPSELGPWWRAAQTEPYRICRRRFGLSFTRPLGRPHAACGSGLRLRPAARFRWVRAGGGC
jgi:transposase